VLVDAFPATERGNAKSAARFSGLIIGRELLLASFDQDGQVERVLPNALAHPSSTFGEVDPPWFQRTSLTEGSCATQHPAQDPRSASGSIRHKDYESACRLVRRDRTRKRKERCPIQWINPWARTALPQLGPGRQVERVLPNALAHPSSTFGEVDPPWFQRTSLTEGSCAT
jgi:hypothetical protein